MLIYSGLKSQFDKDVLSGMIGAKIEHAFYYIYCEDELLREYFKKRVAK